MKYLPFYSLVLLSNIVLGQSIDTLKYSIKVETSLETNRFFIYDAVWRGADGAASVDMGNEKVLWLFGDGFISGDSTRARFQWLTVFRDHGLNRIFFINQIIQVLKSLSCIRQRHYHIAIATVNRLDVLVS